MLYDAIVVGARCAGSPTAMLLARRGYRVLLVDKATFPSDIISTHYIHPPGVERMRAWGFLDKLRATNVPRIRQITLNISGGSFSPPPPPGGPPEIETYCPRRTVLDKILVDAAVAAGAELREGFSVREITTDGGRVTGVRGGTKGGSTVAEEARIVIGADGLHSTVARAVGAVEYNTRPSLSFGYYTYWSGAPLEHAQIHFMEDCGILAFPTNDGLSCIAAGGPGDNFHEFRKDIEGNYMRIMERVPALAEAMRNAKREERFRGTNDQPNYFRRPSGDGWALVGDAGYHRDFVTGLGITDAFRDAELLADAIDHGFSGKRPLNAAMKDYERQRNEIAEPLYELAVAMASGAQPTPEQFIAFGLAMQKMMPPVEQEA